MKINPDLFHIREGHDIDLHECPTGISPFYKSKDHYQTRLTAQIKRLSAAQERFYAEGAKALLVIFQGMDTSGKDGVISHVFSGINPQGCRVTSFKQPSAEELQHDFLWRAVCNLPPRGQIGIFNRSYYEETLITRVHPELLEAQGIPAQAGDNDTFWYDRFRSINDLEQHLVRNGTCVLKFFLHISKQEQRKRFAQRLDDPAKNWKILPSDLKERAFWKDYMRAYAAAITATTTPEAPWYVIPADDKKNARLIVSEIILSALEKLPLKIPELSKARLAELKSIRKNLA